MDINSALTESRWRILEFLAKGPRSPIELAKETSTSIANISAQLRYLEALTLVKKRKTTYLGKGRPRCKYYLVSEFCYFVMVSDRICAKRFEPLNNYSKILGTIMFVPDSTVHYFLHRFYFHFENLVKESIAWAYIGKTAQEVKMLMIANDPSRVSQNFTSVIFNSEAESKKMEVILYNQEQILLGVESSDAHIKNLLNQVYIIFDPESFLSNLKTKKQETI